MEFYNLKKVKLGWMVAPAGFFFEECRIDRTMIVKALIKRNILTNDDLEFIKVRKTRVQSVILPTPKRHDLSEYQKNCFRFISEKQFSFEEKCKAFLAELRKNSEPLLAVDLEIEQCIDLFFIIIPYASDEPIRMYFECDWGDDSSGSCYTALQFSEFGDLKECDQNIEQFGL